MFLVVEVPVIKLVKEAAEEEGRMLGFAGKLGFAFSNWWASYWHLVALLALPSLIAVTVVHAVLPTSPLRRQVGWAWGALLIAGPTVVALTSLAVCYFG